MLRRRVLGAAAGLLLLLAAGCSGGEDPQATASPSPSVSIASAGPAPAPPRVGSCHALDVRRATAPVDTSEPVPCSRPHTTVTVKVGRLTPVQDGHLLAIDSSQVRDQIAAACPPALPRTVGGTTTSQRLSQLRVVWFGPSVEQADAGADWYRCDVVALRSEGTLQTLPATVRGLLSRPGALDRYGTCGTSDPGKAGFARVACSERHTWRAIDVTPIDPKARFLAKQATAAGDAACKDIASGRADGALKYSWSFEWPTRDQWRSGQRYGYCWVPER